MPARFEPIQRLHHFARRCRDAGEARAFHEEVRGLPLTHNIRTDTAR